MKDMTSKKHSQGLRALHHQVQKLGREGYEKHGCNLIAILVDDFEPNVSKPTSIIYETPGASGFFDGHVRSIDKNLLTEHLIAHVHGHSEHREHGTSDQDFEFSDSSDINQRSDADQEVFMPNPRNRQLARRGYNLRRPYFINAKKAIVHEATKAGVDIHWRILPWKRLLHICANFGVYINNYPDDLISPFDAVPYDLGLAGLYDDEHKMLLHALKREKMCPMRFLRVDDTNDITNNEFPVLIYAPPPPDSPRPRSKRIFLDGTYDYRGHRRVEVVRDLDNERQQKRRGPGKPKKKLDKSTQGLESLDYVQHSVRKRRLNEPYADRPEKRNRFVGA